MSTNSTSFFVIVTITLETFIFILQVGAVLSILSVTIAHLEPLFTLSFSYPVQTVYVPLDDIAK